MPGRSCPCLLRIVVFLLMAAPLLGQSGGVRDAYELRAQLPSSTPTPPQVDLRGAPTSPIGNPAKPVGFSTISSAAGTIFSGTVSAIERQPATNGRPIESVAITFHVESAIRGTSPGLDLTISQWIGLWSAGQRYRVGERVLLFLYPPSKLGLTSCVSGPMGRFAVDPWGRVLLTAQHLSSFRRDPILGGKSRVRLSDFARAVQRAEGVN